MNAPRVWERDDEFDGQYIEVFADDQSMHINVYEDGEFHGNVLLEMEEWDAIAAAVEGAEGVRGRAEGGDGMTPLDFSAFARYAAADIMWQFFRGDSFRRTARWTLSTACGRSFTTR